MGGDGHGHGHGHGPPYVVPDYSIYKVENVPKLVAIQKRLAAKGLSDPWLRNEVWRYDRKHFPSIGQNVRMFLMRGVPTATVLFGLTLAYDALTKSEDDHGHGHH